jgi:hypothetical protein
MTPTAKATPNSRQAITTRRKCAATAISAAAVREKLGYRGGAANQAAVRIAMATPCQASWRGSIDCGGSGGTAQPFMVTDGRLPIVRHPCLTRPL